MTNDVNLPFSFSAALWQMIQVDSFLGCLLVLESHSGECNISNIQVVKSHK